MSYTQSRIVVEHVQTLGLACEAPDWQNHICRVSGMICELRSVRALSYPERHNLHYMT